MRRPSFDGIILSAMSVLLMAVIIVTTMLLFFLFGQNVWARIQEVQTVEDVHDTVLRSIGGVFVVLIALELRETFKVYASEHRFRLETVLIVSAISVARHVIQLDFHTVTGPVLAGLGVLIAALVVGYCYLRRLPKCPGMAPDSHAVDDADSKP